MVKKNESVVDGANPPMSEVPNLLELIEAGRKEEAIVLLTKGFRLAAAAGSRSTTAALEAATRLFCGNLEQTIIFMRRPHLQLNGDTPLERAERSDEGLEDVLTLIGRAEAGVYA